DPTFRAAESLASSSLEGARGPPPGDAPVTAVVAVNHATVLMSTVVSISYCRNETVIGMASSFGALLRQAREVRELSATDAARAAGIRAAYLSKLENDAVRRPSPHVLHGLSEALAVPYAE